MIAYDLLSAMGREELLVFFWFFVLLDFPRYLLTAIVLLLIPAGRGAFDPKLKITGMVACYNEAHAIRACVSSMRGNGVTDIIVINDASTDNTHEVAHSLGVTVIDNARRIGKPGCMNIGLAQCSGDAVLVADADTVFRKGSVALALRHLGPCVGGVGFHLSVRNERASLLTRVQAIEYTVEFTMRRLTDALGILANVSGAAGLFRREALQDVGGWDIEVAEDSALTMKLRVKGWEMRYAYDAEARTNVPDDMVSLILQRVRWDASVITIWWRKFGGLLNPFARKLSPSNLFTTLDVLTFGAALPLVLPVYLAWLFNLIGETALILLGAVMIGLVLANVIIILLVGVPLRLLAYLPLYAMVQVFVLRPVRVLALVGELIFSITHFDPYIPADQRGRLS